MTNRAGIDSDGFNAVFGGTAPSDPPGCPRSFPRLGRVISNLNLSNGSNEFNATLAVDPCQASRRDAGMLTFIASARFHISDGASPASFSLMGIVRQEKKSRIATQLF